MGTALTSPSNMYANLNRVDKAVARTQRVCFMLTQQNCSNMMYRSLKFVALGAVLLLVACDRGVDQQALSVPRLALEAGNLTYGQMTDSVVTLPISGSQIAINREILVSEFEIQQVELVQVELGLAIMLQLSDAGARALYRASVASNGRRVVMLVNGNAIAARRLDGPIADGKYYTFVEVNDDALPELVLDLKRSIREIKAQK